MNRDDIIRMAREAGITPWEKMEWQNNQFVSADEGMDGDLACLVQFANFVAAAEREACAKVAEEVGDRDTDTHAYDAAAAIRSRK